MKSVAPVLKILDSYYPDPKTELVYDSPFQLVIAVILSAQCTDARVNLTTPPLFAEFPTAEKMAKAPLPRLEKLIHSCGFYKNKAKAIKHAADLITTKFGGEVPRSMEDLMSLGGVGRKTASVVMNQAFDLPAIAVDTHVNRVANRLGWASSSNPLIVERQLKELVPEKDWAGINGWLILHGRRICKARKPLCEECPLTKYCDFYKGLTS